MISEQTIQQAARLLGEAAKPAKVILFGSYARWIKPFVVSLSNHERLNRPPFDKLRANG